VKGNKSLGRTHKGNNSFKKGTAKERKKSPCFLEERRKTMCLENLSGTIKSEKVFDRM
jgi:hypothetical protein